MLDNDGPLRRQMHATDSVCLTFESEIDKLYKKRLHFLIYLQILKKNFFNLSLFFYFVEEFESLE